VFAPPDDPDQTCPFAPDIAHSQAVAATGAWSGHPSSRAPRTAVSSVYR
jgi:hypothetical protein